MSPYLNETLTGPKRLVYSGDIESLAFQVGRVKLVDGELEQDRTRGIWAHRNSQGEIVTPMYLDFDREKIEEFLTREGILTGNEQTTPAKVSWSSLNPLTFREYVQDGELIQDRWPHNHEADGPLDTARSKRYGALVWRVQTRLVGNDGKLLCSTQPGWQGPHSLRYSGIVLEEAAQKHVYVQAVFSGGELFFDRKKRKGMHLAVLSAVKAVHEEKNVQIRDIPLTGTTDSDLNLLLDREQVLADREFVTTRLYTTLTTFFQENDFLSALEEYEAIVKISFGEVKSFSPNSILLEDAPPFDGFPRTRDGYCTQRAHLDYAPVIRGLVEKVRSNENLRRAIAYL
jgi:hypothetical protein